MAFQIQSPLRMFLHRTKTKSKFISSRQWTKLNRELKRQTNLQPPQWVSQIRISVKKPACFRSRTEKILRWKALSLRNITNLEKKKIKIIIIICHVISTHFERKIPQKLSCLYIQLKSKASKQPTLLWLATPTLGTQFENVKAKLSLTRKARPNL